MSRVELDLDGPARARRSGFLRLAPRRASEADSGTGVRHPPRTSPGDPGHSTTRAHPSPSGVSLRESDKRPDRKDANLTAGTLTNPVTVGNLGTDIQTVTAYRQVREGTTVTADVWVVTRTDGSLDQVIIPSATPAAYTVTELRASGFAGLKSLTAGWCGDYDTNRVLGGVTTKGELRMWFDPNSNDSNGSDIVGGSAVVAKGWRNVTYS